MNPDSIIQAAFRTIELEAAAIAQLAQQVDTGFEKAIELLRQAKGRLVVSGVGKSALVARKLVATFNSTGTPSIFLHAGDAIHGDLGMVQKEDILLVISKSGNSPEIKMLVPLVKQFGNPLIGMVGNMQSYLALQSDLVINATVEKEACPNNLAPTSSTTAQMVMGDALAICLMEAKGFGTADFARFHPGGALGKKLYLRVEDLAAQNPLPAVSINADIPSIILEMTNKRLGATAVIAEGNTIAGIITDGDLRRMLEKKISFDNLTAKDIMSPHPKTIEKGAMAVDAMELMKKNDISQLLIVHESKYAGIIHLHDLIREGII